VSGATFRGEQFGANVLIGAAVLIGGVWLAQRRPAAAATAAELRQQQV
jgi:drug/metabolite transporter (DMT)-like permease